MGYGFGMENFANPPMTMKRILEAQSVLSVIFDSPESEPGVEDQMGFDPELDCSPIEVRSLRWYARNGGDLFEDAPLENEETIVFDGLFSAMEANRLSDRLLSLI